MKCDLCEEKDVTCFCNGCSRYICQTCCKVHVKCSHCKVENAVPVEEQLAKLEEGLFNIGIQLEIKTKGFLKEKDDYIKNVAECTSIYLKELDESKAEIIKYVTFWFDDVKNALIKIKGDAISAAKDKGNSIAELAQKNLTEIAEIKAQVLMANHDTLKQKMQHSLDKIKTEGFVPFEFILTRGNPKALLQTDPAPNVLLSVGVASERETIAITGHGAFEHKFQNVSKLTTSQQKGTVHKIADFSWYVLMKDTYDNHRKWAGFFVRCFKNGEHEKWQCKAEVKVNLVAQKSFATSITRTFIHTFNSSEDNAWGIPAYIEYQKLLDPKNGFVVGDEIIMKVSIQCMVPEMLFLKENKVESSGKDKETIGGSSGKDPTGGEGSSVSGERSSASS